VRDGALSSSWDMEGAVDGCFAFMSYRVLKGLGPKTCLLEGVKLL